MPNRRPPYSVNEGRERLLRVLELLSQFNEIKRGMRQPCPNEQEGYKGHQSWQEKDYDDWAPNTRGKSPVQEGPLHGGPQFHGEGSQHRSASQGRTQQNDTQGYAMRSQGKKWQQGAYHKIYQNRPPPKQGDFQNNCPEGSVQGKPWQQGAYHKDYQNRSSRDQGNYQNNGPEGNVQEKPWQQGAYHKKYQNRPPPDQGDSQNNGPQGYASRGQGRKWQQNRPPPRDQGHFQTNSNFRGRGGVRGNFIPSSSYHNKNSAANVSVQNISVEPNTGTAVEIAHLNTKFQNLSVSNVAATLNPEEIIANKNILKQEQATGNKPKTKKNRNRKKSKAAANGPQVKPETKDDWGPEECTPEVKTLSAKNKKHTKNVKDFAGTTSSASTKENDNSNSTSQPVKLNPVPGFDDSFIEVLSEKVIRAPSAPMLESDLQQMPSAPPTYAQAVRQHVSYPEQACAHVPVQQQNNMPPQPIATTVTTTTVFVDGIPVGPTSVRMNCPMCHMNIKTSTTTENQPSAHIACTGLFLIGCFLCSCLPYCMDSFQSVHHSCPNCKAFLGTYKA